MLAVVRKYPVEITNVQTHGEKPSLALAQYHLITQMCTYAKNDEETTTMSSIEWTQKEKEQDLRFLKPSEPLK